MIDLTGKTALVTGAARGIGLGIALALAEAGARIAVNDLDPDAAELVARQLGRGSFPVPGDVSDEAAVDAIVTSAQAPAGLDILINNAGIAETPGPIGRQRPGEWQHVMNVNLRGPYLMSRAASSCMKRGGGGAIVNIASITGIVGFPASHAYGVSKAALVMLTKTLAGELAKHSIRVNAVAPGVIDTPMLHDVAMERDRLSAFVSRTLLGRLGTAADVGNAVTFLCSSAAAYITGVTLPVDGGWLAFGGAGHASAPWMGDGS